MDVGDPNDPQADVDFSSTLGTGNYQTQLLGSQHYIGVDFNTTPLNQPNNGVMPADWTSCLPWRLVLIRFDGFDFR
jgi:hypothetical protein